jgi:hypothetical protein
MIEKIRPVRWLDRIRYQACSTVLYEMTGLVALGGSDHLLGGICEALGDDDRAAAL